MSLYEVAVVLQLLFSLTFSFLYFRERARRRESETWGRHLYETYQQSERAREYERVQGERQRALERVEAAQRIALLDWRLETIRREIGRRPPRRKWLALAYRVAKVASGAPAFNWPSS